jgi:hypothetical protein
MRQSTKHRLYCITSNWRKRKKVSSSMSHPQMRTINEKICSFSLIERVILERKLVEAMNTERRGEIICLSAGAMLIFL